MEKACTFFGHSNAPSVLEKKIFDAARCLIEKEGVLVFYIGTHGSFDNMAYTAVKKLKKIYSNIQYYRVLSQIPTKRDIYLDREEDTLIPEGLENVHGRYSVVHRNRWMLSNSEYVITHVTHSWGGAATFKKMAETRGKMVINLI